jgi:predicted nucleotidyltransferase
MNKNQILQKLKQLKAAYIEDGFIVLGLFGSYARGENKQSSDIDILYDLDTNKFLSKNPGFRAFNKLSALKETFQKEFNQEVDLADITTLNCVGKDKILKETIYV